MYKIQATYTPDPDAVGGRILKGELHNGEYLWRFKGAIVDFCPWTGKELLRTEEEVYAAAQADQCWLEERCLRESYEERLRDFDPSRALSL